MNKCHFRTCAGGGSQGTPGAHEIPHCGLSLANFSDQISNKKVGGHSGKSSEFPETLGKSDSLPATCQNCLQFLAHRNRSDFCDLRLRCPSRTPEIARFPRQDKALLHCNLRVRWKVASDLRFRAAISEPKTPSFCGISGDLAPSTRKSLAIAIVRFWCAKLQFDVDKQKSITQSRGFRGFPRGSCPVWIWDRLSPKAVSMLGLLACYATRPTIKNCRKGCSLSLSPPIWCFPLEPFLKSTRAFPVAGLTVNSA